MGGSDDGYVAMNAPAWEAERKVLAQRPERAAQQVIDGIAVDGTGFGSVPGGQAAAGRVRAWTDRSRTEMARVAAEVADLERGTAALRDLSVAGEARTTAAAKTGTPR